MVGAVGAVIWTPAPDVLFGALVLAMIFTSRPVAWVSVADIANHAVPIARTARYHRLRQTGDNVLIGTDVRPRSGGRGARSCKMGMARRLERRSCEP